MSKSKPGHLVRWDNGKTIFKSRHRSMKATLAAARDLDLSRASLFFDFGLGKVPAHKHPNGDGWVANTAMVEESAFIGESALVFDSARVGENAWVYGRAQVFGSARVCENARVFDGAQVSGNARVCGYARVGGDALVFGSAQLYEHAFVSTSARVSGYARVLGSALVNGHAQVYGHVQVGGYARVFGNAKVFGSAQVSDRARVGGDAQLSKPSDLAYALIREYEVTVVKEYIQVGCEVHTIEEWASFTGGEIDDMDDGALEWWNDNKEHVFEMHEKVSKA